MKLDPDFSEFIDCCVRHDVRFLVVGGYALAAHGHPRFTHVPAAFTPDAATVRELLSPHTPPTWSR
jgi:hypothetical protein